MNLSKRFEQIRKFLVCHETLHQKEAMNHYPNTYPSPYHDWINELALLNQKQQIEIENNFETSSLKIPAHIEYWETVKQLIELPTQKSVVHQVHSHLFRGINVKKKHEINQIIDLVKHKEGLNSILDIGGGQGHLCTHLAQHIEASFYSIDLDQKLQENGMKRLAKWSPQSLDKIQFITEKINGRLNWKKSDPKKTLLIGLHSCGALSSWLVQSCINENFQSLLNFGCCYHKLDNEYNLSKTAQNNPVWFEIPALTLASKGFKILSAQEIQKRVKLKNYRYTLHFYSIDKNLNFNLHTGNIKASDLDEDFLLFFQKYFPMPTKKISLDVHPQKYYLSEQNKLNLKYYQSAGILRSALSRVIELYIVLDRALYAQEHGRGVRIVNSLNRLLSPRNIALEVL